jgi:RNA polymerase sigma-70 factor (ECF subfamily)
MPEDFGRMYAAYGPVVQRALRQLGVDPGQIDDAAQDVFVVLHRRLRDYDAGRSLTNWLWGIAKGVASTYRRSARRRQRLHEALPLTPSSEPRTLDDHVAHRQATRVLQDFLASLDADKCAVFVLAEVEGCTGPEIAERLSVNLNTVYARLRAARRHFDDAVQRHRPSPLQAALGGLLAWPLGAKTAVASGACVLAAALVVPALPVAEAPSLRIELAPVSTEAEDDGEAIAILESPPRTRTARLPAKDVDEDPIVIDDDEVEETPMKRTSLAAVAISGALAATVATPAHAKKPKPGDEWLLQDADEAARKGTDGTTRLYEFDNDHVGGDRLAPDGTMLMQRPPLTHKSLIDIRGHFMPELVRLAEDV